MADVVYVVRPGEGNEELRFSLRSLAAHLPHDTVHITGHRPAWVTGANHIATVQRGRKHDNAKRNLVEALSSGAVADEVIMIDDDMFVMHPLALLPVMHLGPLERIVKERRATRRRSRYTQALADTLTLLRKLGVHDPVSYDGHWPMLFDRAALLDALQQHADPHLHWRTTVGNMGNVGGVEVTDCKNPPAPFEAWSFLSTTDHTFGREPIGAYVRSQFIEPCGYER